MPILNIAAYRYTPLQDLISLKNCLLSSCLSLDIKGTILLSPEGFNLMLAASVDRIQSLRRFLEADVLFARLSYKEGYSDHTPFRKMCVKLKKQIIPFEEGYQPMPSNDASRLAPAQLKQWLDEGKPLFLLDTRNTYEVAQGTFQQAHQLNLKHFRQFGSTLKSYSPPHDVPVVAFCTGGVRCEKVVPFLKSQGYDEVYQLEGGILQYFKDCGKAHYDGECFVFDERVTG